MTSRLKELWATYATLLPFVAITVAYILYTVFPEWNGWFPLVLFASVIGGVFAMMFYISAEEHARQAWEQRYNAMTPEQKVDYHMDAARHCVYHEGANYHNQMAQTIILKERL